MKDHTHGGRVEHGEGPLVQRDDAGQLARAMFLQGAPIAFITGRTIRYARYSLGEMVLEFEDGASVKITGEFDIAIRTAPDATDIGVDLTTGELKSGEDSTASELKEGGE